MLCLTQDTSQESWDQYILSELSTVLIKTIRTIYFMKSLLLYDKTRNAFFVNISTFLIITDLATCIHVRSRLF